MSDTPRTDVVVHVEVTRGLNNVCKTYWVSADFARELERELNEINAQGGHLYCTTCGSCGEDGCCPPATCWRKRAEQVVDIYFDGIEHRHEDRAYADGTLPELMQELRAALAKTPQPVNS